jgi:hypothetical protein
VRVHDCNHMSAKKTYWNDKLSLGSTRSTLTQIGDPRQPKVHEANCCHCHPRHLRNSYLRSMAIRQPLRCLITGANTGTGWKQQLPGRGGGTSICVTLQCGYMFSGLCEVAAYLGHAWDPSECAALYVCGAQGAGDWVGGGGSACI